MSRSPSDPQASVWRSARPAESPDLQSVNRFNADYVSEISPVIIGGCARSGTTLARVILDSHKNLCCGPESGLFFRDDAGIQRLANKFDVPLRKVRSMAQRSNSRAEFIEKFFDFYARVCGKPRWAEKSPRNVQTLDYVFGVFPKARFLHMVRDGRDVACSLRTFPRHSVEEGRLKPLGTWNDLGPGIERWVSDISASLAYRADPRYLEVRYEDLVLETRNTLQKVLKFIGEPWDDAVLRHYEISSGSRDVTKFPQNPEAVRPIIGESIGRWRRDLAATEQALFKEKAGSLLVDLGYETSYGW